MLVKLKALPLRKSLGVPAFAVALIAFGWATTARGLFDGITLLIGASAFILTLLQRIPVRPKLEVVPRDGGVLIAKPAKPMRPLEEEEIADEQSELCRNEMPRMPAPSFPPGNPLIEHLAGFRASERLMVATTGVSDDHLRDYLQQVSDYADGVRDWISRLEEARAYQVRLFEGKLRVRELGQAAAEHLHLRLRFPVGFELDEDPPEVGLPPVRPQFESFRRPYAAGLRINDIVAHVGSIRLPGTDKPLYSTENGLAQADFDLGRVNQSDYRDVPSFRLRAAPPGEYEIEWQITATGLSKPIRGTAKIKVEPPQAGEAILTLAEAEAERRDYELH